MRPAPPCSQAANHGPGSIGGTSPGAVKAWRHRSQHPRSTSRWEVVAVKAQGAEAPSTSRPWEGDSGRVSSSVPEADTVGTRARQLQALQRRQPCQQCGGRGVVAGIKSPVPCPTCQTWRRSPSYEPGQSLLRVRDLNLSALDGDASSSSSSSSARQGFSRRLIDLPASASGKESSTAASRQKRPMPEAQREAIKAALQNRGPFTPDHKRSISRAMRDAHAKNPMLSGSGRPKKCSHCGGEGHNKLTCPVLHPERAQQAVEAAAAKLLPPQRLCSVCGQPGHYKNACPEAAAAAAAAEAAMRCGPRKLIVIEDEAGQAGSGVAAGATSPAAAAAPRDGGAPAVDASHTPRDAHSHGRHAAASGSSDAAADAALDTALDAAALGQHSDAAAKDPAARPRVSGGEAAPLSLFTDYSGGAAVARDLVPTVRVGPGMSLSPEGSWVFPLPARRGDCVQQAASAVLRAWDDGIRRQNLELLLPNAAADGGWPGGIRQQFRAAQPLVEALLRQLKAEQRLEGRVTPEWLDESDCVAAWQSERLAAVLFPTADSLPALQRVDDALSGERLTMLINAQWQTQGQVISDFGFGRSRKAAERFVASFDDVYYLRRIRVFGDDIRVLRCYPGQWQVHYVTPGREVLLLGCEDEKPTYERLMQLLKAVQGSRISKSWLDRVMSMGSYDAAAYPSYEDERQGESPLEASTATAASAPSPREAGAAPRDIITGEIITGGVLGAAADARDYKLDSVKEIAKWLS